jgi:hypothetical protein
MVMSKGFRESMGSSGMWEERCQEEAVMSGKQEGSRACHNHCVRRTQALPGL